MLFASDLDNTLIYSYKSAKAEDICVEVKEGKKLSFMPPLTYALLPKIAQRCCFVPVTTRSLEQYRRLDLGVKPEYAVVAHGALLLINGEVDEQWMRETRKLLKIAFPPDTALSRIRETDLVFDIRCVDSFFIFAKSEFPLEAAQYLRSIVDEKLFTVDAVHNKIYILPRGLDKGLALQRLRKRLGVRHVICAGDSTLDIPMLRNADLALFPQTLSLRRPYGCVLDAQTFTSEMLQVVWELLSKPLPLYCK